MTPRRFTLSILFIVAISPLLANADTLEMRHVLSDRDQADVVMHHSDEELFLSKPVGITEADISTAKAEQGNNGWQILVTLTDDGATKFTNVTKIALKKRLAVIVNKKILTAPTIQDILTGGQFIISGDFTEIEAQRLAADLTSKKRI